jgi:hypothetical protein
MTDMSTHKGDFGARVDAVVLAILVVAMCSQIDPLSLGRDTLAEGLGYASKTYKIAVCDIALVLATLWFILRTTQQKAWRKIWWSPLPCWALIFAMILSAIHAPHVLNAFVTAYEKSSGFQGLKAGLRTQEFQGAVVDIVQYTAYFVVAPLLFVNWIHDRRCAVFVDRKKLALWAFCGAVALNVLAAIVQLLAWDKSAPRGLWTSPNIYGVFLATSIPLLMLLLRAHRATKSVGYEIALALLALGALLTLVSPWTILALFIGVLVAGLAARQRFLTSSTLIALLAGTFLAWNLQTDLKANRDDFLNVASATEAVKKQYIEWFAAARWSVPQGADLGGSAQQLHHFETGVGPGNYQGNIGPYYGSLPNEEKMPPDSNNLYLVQAVSIGVLGLAALLWMSTHFAHQAVVARRLNPENWISHGALGSVCAFAVVVIFHAGIVRGMSLVLAFVFALCVIARESAERNLEDKNAI